MNEQLNSSQPQIKAASLKKELRVSDIIWNLAVAIILLYVFNNLLNNIVFPLDPNISKDYPGFIVNIVNNLSSLQVPFITKYLIHCMWAINLFFSLAIVGNLFLLLYRPRWFQHFIQAVLAGLIIVPLYVIHNVFPFNFTSPTTVTIVKDVLIAMMAGFGIACVSETVRFVIDLRHSLLNAQLISPIPPSAPPVPPSSNISDIPQI